jgi:exodeoxyribonuclease-5
MTWSPGQDRVLKDIRRRWLKQRDQQVYRLGGYAGVGKTLVAAEIGAHAKSPVFVAVTGKAADVLRRRGCAPVSTIHKLIYDSYYDPDQKRYFSDLKSPDELKDYDLIVVDEASMVNEKLARDLLSFGRKLLIVYDPFQLPPPDNSGLGFFMRGEPDAVLTEIHRQARDNPIVDLATRIRQGESLPGRGYRAGNAVRIVDNETPHYLTHDTMLCGSNDMRRRCNNRQRYARGFVKERASRDEPQLGETLLCLRNDVWVCDPVWNGTQWIVQDKEQVGDQKLPILWMLLRSAHDGETEVQVPSECFSEHRFVFRPRFQMFDFGYALTVHKSQGSEWESVLLINEAPSFRDQAARWLYTGITRAEEKLTIVDYN